MKECSKSISRRMRDPNFINKYFVGNGLDVGGLPDPLSIYQELFCQMGNVCTWDWNDGDAQYLKSLANDELDFVHSSHCLEHLVDPFIGLENWLRVTKPGGYVIVTLPDEDLYEQGVWPPTFNKDHKHSFTIHKKSSWCEKSINVFELLTHLGEQAEIVKVELLNSNYRYNLPRYDQTLTPIAECGIEFIIRKREIGETGVVSLRNPINEVSEEIKIHLNQYTDDMAMMKSSNNGQVPFQNRKEIDF
jgi:SAM-dependent methyltransferase